MESTVSSSAHPHPEATERTGRTICSFSTRTWGLWMEGEKKRHPISQIPHSPSLSSQGHHVKHPPSFSRSLSLFFFNQAVWGCQVFWEEDSEPCEKLIPRGPSSPRRSSPWEPRSWLSSRWLFSTGGWGRWEVVGHGGRREGWTQLILYVKLQMVR